MEQGVPSGPVVNKKMSFRTLKNLIPFAGSIKSLSLFKMSFFNGLCY